MHRGSLRNFMLAGVIMQCHNVALGASPTMPPLAERVARQVALETVGFSPGLIDGRLGPKTALALREFQRVHGLPITGEFDAESLARLGVNPAGALTRHVVADADFAEVDPPPKDWVGKSQRHRLGYESVEAALAEKFHCSKSLLAELNPGRNWHELRPGDVLTVPAVPVASLPTRGALLEVDVAQKVIRVLDVRHRLVALFHCSIAADKAKVPTGETRVAVISENPTYTFDPKMWPEVKDVDRKLTIPPGPRNPVGRCWIGLSLPGYGIHGTPNPELIGKTGSHGCFRLANWDAQRLGKMIEVGAKVCFVSDAATSRIASAR